MATIATVKEAIMLTKDARITPMIWGAHGIGKSSLVKELTLENQMGLIDYRLSQIEATEMRGLPDKTEDGRTTYCAPVEFPIGGMEWEEMMELVDAEETETRKLQVFQECQPRLNKGVLFLDESFRGQDDVMQAMFELVLDRKLGQRVLPTGWHIVCANNFFEGYYTNSFKDPALLDRFCHITLSSSGDEANQEWADYMSKTHNDEVSGKLISFCMSCDENLNGKDQAHDLGFNITPTKRAWDAVARVDTVYRSNIAAYTKEAVRQVIAGLVGLDMALAYENFSCPVAPADVINKGVKAVDKELRTLDRSQKIGNKIVKKVLDFAEWVLKNTDEKDLALGFLTGILASGDNPNVAKFKAAALVNEKLAAIINKAESSAGRKNGILQSVNKRPKLAALIKDTVWGRGEEK